MGFHVSLGECTGFRGLHRSLGPLVWGSMENINLPPRNSAGGVGPGARPLSQGFSGWLGDSK